MIGIKPRLVDIENIELQLSSELPSEMVDELYRFGQIIVTDAKTTAGQLDSKLVTVLGWTSAALAFLLLNKIAGTSPSIRFAIVAATVCALVGTVIAGWGLKSTLWVAPSEQDWFKTELMENAGAMRRYHIVSMLVSHQITVNRNAVKAVYLRLAELCLIGGSLFIGVALALQML